MEITYAVIAFNGIATREFNTFPGDIWTRSTKWVNRETKEYMTKKEAKRQFEAGEKVLYHTKDGYTAYVVYSPTGRTPTRSK